MIVRLHVSRCSTSVVHFRYPALNKSLDSCRVLFLSRICITPAFHCSKLLHNINSRIQFRKFNDVTLRNWIFFSCIQCQCDYRLFLRLRSCLLLGAYICIGFRFGFGFGLDYGHICCLMFSSAVICCQMSAIRNLPKSRVLTLLVTDSLMVRPSYQLQIRSSL